MTEQNTTAEVETSIAAMNTDYDVPAQISAETPDESDAKADELTKLVDMVRSKKPAPAAKVAAAPSAKTKGRAKSETSVVAAPTPNASPTTEKSPPKTDDTVRLFQLGKIPPNVRGFRGYARAQIVHLNDLHPSGFTQKQFRDALVSNAAGVEQPSEPTVGWAKHNFPTWCASQAWIVPFVAAVAEASAEEHASAE